MIGHVTIGTNDCAKANAAHFRNAEGNKFCAFRMGPES